jgi:zinc protease
MKLAAAVLALALLAGPAAAAEVKNLDIGRGAEAWFTEDHTVPVIAFVFSLPAGSAYDPAAKPGLAEFAATMLDEGAGNLDAEAYRTQLATLAIEVTAKAERDDLVVSVTTLSGNAATAMRLVGLALAHPRFDADAVARVRAQLIDRLRSRAENPADLANDALMNVFFNGHPYGHAPDGDEAGLGAITADDLRDFTRIHWVRGGIRVAVAGDVTAPALAGLLKTALAPLGATEPPPITPIGRLGAPGLHNVAMRAAEPVVRFGLPGIMRADPDFAAGEIAAYILGGGGPIQGADEAGSPGRISARLVPLRRASMLEGEVATGPEAIGQTVATVRETLAKFAASGPTAEALANAKAHLTGAFPLDFASNAGTAAELGLLQREGFAIDYAARHDALIDAVTIDDVRRVAKRLFNPARLTIMVAGSGGSPVPP